MERSHDASCVGDGHGLGHRREVHGTGNASDPRRATRTLRAHPARRSSSGATAQSMRRANDAGGLEAGRARRPDRPHPPRSARGRRRRRRPACSDWNSRSGSTRPIPATSQTFVPWQRAAAARSIAPKGTRALPPPAAPVSMIRCDGSRVSSSDSTTTRTGCSARRSRRESWSPSPRIRTATTSRSGRSDEAGRDDVGPTEDGHRVVVREGEGGHEAVRASCRPRRPARRSRRRRRHRGRRAPASRATRASPTTGDGRAGAGTRPRDRPDRHRMRRGSPPLRSAAPDHRPPTIAPGTADARRVAPFDPTSGRLLFFGRTLRVNLIKSGHARTDAITRARAGKGGAHQWWSSIAVIVDQR